VHSEYALIANVIAAGEGATYHEPPVETDVACGEPFFPHGCANSSSRLPRADSVRCSLINEIRGLAMMNHASADLLGTLGGRTAASVSRIESLAERRSRQLGRLVVGQSDAWQAVVRMATQVAATETTVVLHGESGTGKEVVAQLIHRVSPRREGPFVALNCAALPAALLESELFGYDLRPQPRDERPPRTTQEPEF
jgi:hypothetical protein